MGRFDAEEQKAVALAAMAENFGKELSAALAGLWLDLLAPYSVAHVQAAVRAVIERYEYKTMPPFAVLKRELDAQSGTDAKTVEALAQAEWTALLDALARRGACAPPDDLHPTTAHVLRAMGGWEAACQWDTHALDFKRRDFCELWAQADGKADLFSLGAAGMRKAIEQRGGLAPAGAAALPGRRSAALAQGA